MFMVCHNELLTFRRNHETQNGILTIPFLKVEDAGEYVCSASNEFGVSQAIVVLRIGGTWYNFYDKVLCLQCSKEHKE